ncbi:MAG: type VI secretion system accessory protein TagJ [Pseudorhodobacter sp.]
MTETATLNELLDRNALDEAIRAATEQVKLRARDLGVRLQLAELCVISGDLERAETHAKLSSTLSPDDVVGLGVFRQHLRGMHARAEWWQKGAMPTFPMGPTQCDSIALKLNIALREGDGDGAKAALDALEAARGEYSGIWNGIAAEDIRDLDDRIPHAFEAITAGGNYLWLDMSIVTEISFQPIRRPIDLAYRRARVTLKDGAGADLLLPNIYWDTDDDMGKLARNTSFEPLPGGLMTGRGQRAYLVGEDMKPALEAETLVFASGKDA